MAIRGMGIGTEIQSPWLRQPWK